tara:strand:- start:651 stop:1868 length:1218 start_codon:yes stop_codon:yes gene_type:complete
MAIAYCTDRELKDIYPHVDDYDNKVPIYGWESLGDNLYLANNCGSITMLYKDGKELKELTSSLFGTFSASSLDTNETLTPEETSITLDGSVGLDMATGYIVKIENEYILITSSTGSTLTKVIRGVLNTDAVVHATDQDVTVPSISGATLARLDGTSFDYIYDSHKDRVLLYSTTDPNDLLMQAGEDFVTLKQRFRENASRYLESKIDKNLPREQFKDKDGNYDYVVVRTTALLATCFLIRSHDPTSEVATSFWEEANTEIDKLNSGENTLSWMTTADSSKGIVRESSVSGNIRIVDTRGRYGGTYDRIGVKITNAGAIGTAKYSVWVKDSDNIGAERMNNGATADLADEVINGQFQSLSSGLQIKFGGDTADTATLNDKWEVEVSGYYEEVDNATSMRAVRMTRV